MWNSEQNNLLGAYHIARWLYVRFPLQTLLSSLIVSLQVKQAIQALDLPNNPLDQLIDQLGGPDCIAEMTGELIIYAPRTVCS